jgi:hypothetical protein
MANFIRYGGNYIPRQPYDMQSVTAFGFAANGDQKKMQALCDRTLNFRGEAPYYKVISPTVLFSFMRMNTLRSIDPEDSQKGSYSETEFSMTLLLAAGAHVAGVFVPERILWHAPYLWLDSNAALIAGREIYGYAKQFGTVAMPRAERDPAVFGASAEVISRFAPNARSSVQPIVGVHRTDAPVLEYERGCHAVEDAVTVLLDEVMEMNLADLIAGSIVETLTLQHLLSLVFLRQLPDIANASRACYQSVAEAPFDVTRFGGAGLLAGKYAIDITKHDSAPIAAELGFESTNPEGDARVVPRAGYYLDFDFRLHAGKEVWVAR